MAVTKARLNECLETDSYQDMTDEEINAVITYKEEQAAINKSVELAKEENKSAMAAMQEYYAAKAESEKERLQQLINTRVNLITEIGGEANGEETKE